MDITAAVFTEDGAILAIIDGVALTVPDDPANRHRQALADWEAAGNNISPFTPPPTSRDDVNRERDRRIATMFSFAGVAYQLDEISISRVTAMGADARFAVLGGAASGNLRWADPDNDFGWIATDNSTTPMDAQTMTAFSDAAKIWVFRHTFAGDRIKAMQPIPTDITADELWPS